MSPSWRDRISGKLRDRFNPQGWLVSVYSDKVRLGKGSPPWFGSLGPRPIITIHYSGLKAQTVDELIREIETEIAIRNVCDS